MDATERNARLATIVEAIPGTSVCPNGLPLEIFRPEDEQVKSLAGQVYSYVRKDEATKRIVWQVRESKRDVPQPKASQANGPVHVTKGEPAKAPKSAKAAPAPAKAAAAADTRVAVRINVYANGRVEIIPA